MEHPTNKQHPNCGMSFEQHVLDLVQGLLVGGLGSACSGTYQVLVEMTDYMKRYHGHDYTAQSLITKDNINNLLEKGYAEKVQMSEQANSQEDAGFAQYTSDGKVH